MLVAHTVLCTQLDLSDNLSYYFDTLVHVISQTFQVNLYGTSNVEGELCSFGEEIQTFNLNIYSITQTQKLP